MSRAEGAAREKIVEGAGAAALRASSSRRGSALQGRREGRKEGALRCWVAASTQSLRLNERMLWAAKLPVN